MLPVSQRCLARLIATIVLLIALFWVINEKDFEPFIVFLQSIGAFIAAFFVPNNAHYKKSTWQYFLQFIAIITFPISLVWVIYSPSFEAAIIVIQGILFIGVFSASDKPINWKKAMSDRNLLLMKVESYWIKGVLEKSLRGTTLLHLNMEYIFNDAKHPQKHPSIIDVFDKANGAFLLLGQPGSGKTITLLELTRNLINRAKRNDSQQIPVVFNLSSWSLKRQPLAEWLVDELYISYQIPSEIGKAWVLGHRLCLLLDGLDEVAKKHQDDCVTAINEFRQEFGFSNIVVCSRTADYDDLTNKLALSTVLAIKPLTDDQIDSYLSSTGITLTAVRQTLKHDVVFKELAQLPLMLNVMIVAYQGKSMRDLHLLGTIEARRKHIFDSYVQRVFEHRNNVSQPASFSKNTIIDGLSWLSKKMLQDSLTTFHMELIEPTWLSTVTEKRIYVFTHRLFSGLTGGIPGMLIGILIGLLKGDMVSGIAIGLVASFPGALSGGMTSGTYVGLSGMTVGILTTYAIRELSTLSLIGFIGEFVAAFLVGFLAYITLKLSQGKVSWGSLIFRLCTGLVSGIMIVLVATFIGVQAGILTVQNAFGLIVGVLIGLFIGIILGLTAGKLEFIYKKLMPAAQKYLAPNIRHDDVDIKETVNWEFSRLPIIAAIGGGLAGLLLDWWLFSTDGRIAFSLGLAMLGWLLGGSKTGAGKIDDFEFPNQAVWKSLNNGLIWSLGTFIFVGLIMGFILGPLHGLIIGIAMSIVIGAILGGLAFARHFILRLILYTNGYIPWRLSRFLDYATEIVLVRKVGGGYMFIHRFLLEYFATLQSDEQTDRNLVL